MRFWKWCDRVIPHLPKRRPDDRLHVSLAGLDRRRHRTPVACGRRRPHAVQGHLGPGFDAAVGRRDPSRGNLHNIPYEAHSQCAASRLFSTPGAVSPCGDCPVTNVPGSVACCRTAFGRAFFFPPDFAFLLTRQEFANLKSHFATSSSGWGGRRDYRELSGLRLRSMVTSSGGVEPPPRSTTRAPQTESQSAGRLL